MLIEQLQQAVLKHGLDGWLFYDFRGSNPLAYQLLGLRQIPTRRFFYWVPSHGPAVKLVHRIESGALDTLPGLKVEYAAWRELEDRLDALLKGAHRIAMEYSPGNLLPYVSSVDAGTIEQIRKRGVEIVSSADLLLLCSPKQDEPLQRTHLAVTKVLSDTIQRAWHWIRDHIEGEAQITEWDVVDFLYGEFAAQGIVTEHPLCCAAGANSADPHYHPSEERCSAIKRGDWILLDIYGHFEGGLYGDITKVAIADKRPSEAQMRIFEIVVAAREAALSLAKERVASGQRLYGFELDRAAREVVERAGFGSHFIHRTGHDMGFECHGRGAHLDDYETHDARPILPGTLFTIEPGIYLPGEFGVRLECDVVVTPEGELIVTGEPQNQIVTLF